jgi:hypothetical protein
MKFDLSVLDLKVKMIDGGGEGGGNRSQEQTLSLPRIAHLKTGCPVCLNPVLEKCLASKGQNE